MKDNGTAGIEPKTGEALALSVVFHFENTPITKLKCHARRKKILQILVYFWANPSGYFQVT